MNQDQLTQKNVQPQDRIDYVLDRYTSKPLLLDRPKMIIILLATTLIITLVLVGIQANKIEEQAVNISNLNKQIANLDKKIKEQDAVILKLQNQK